MSYADLSGLQRLARGAVSLDDLVEDKAFVSKLKDDKGTNPFLVKAFMDSLFERGLVSVVQNKGKRGYVISEDGQELLQQIKQVAKR